MVTRFQFRLQPIDAIVGGMLVLPATPRVLADFIALAEAAPEELSTIVNVMPAPPVPFVPEEHHGQLIIWAFLVYAGDGSAESMAAGERVLAPFRALAKPISDMLRPMRYLEMFPSEGGGYHPTAVSRNMFVDRVDLTVAQQVIETLAASDATMRVAHIRVLGGAMARVPVEATAFPHRRSRIMVFVAAFYTGHEDRAVRDAWVADFAAALHQGDSGTYVNFLGPEGRDWLQNAYPGPTWDRLAAIKARYDPTNLFHLNHNIPPGS